MFRAGTLLVSGQNSNVQKYVHVQGKANNSHSHGLTASQLQALPYIQLLAYKKG